MYDTDSDSDGESTYECLNCGRIVTAESYPGTCSECGSEFRNRGTMIE
ncbi:hypothetical protein BRC77_11420 [Halobacteriales archaeon QH_8_64_26]|jgi:DNA-directed RNA polymerase subunit RPC12/RpoP|nr:MAG: hypothetical protein BRC77_11420 [Halobacteriales archaeon QH_8_64_26]